MIIYKITNIVNGKFYIGKTTLTIQARFRTHYYNHFNSNTHLYRAMRKYGFDNFCIEELESNVIDLNQSEIRFIAELKPQYNMTQGGDGGDTSSSENFINSMKIYHASKTPKDYATYGMLGKSHPGKGKSLLANCKKVSCEGVVYNSIKEAQAAYSGISIHKRLDSSKYPEFFRI